MDDQALMELLAQIQELAGLGLEALAGGFDEGGGEEELSPEEEEAMMAEEEAFA